MDFDLAPPIGVGPLRIGMTRQSANTALDSLRDLSAVSESDRPGQHVFRPSGLMISIHCTRDTLEAVELGRPSTQTDRVIFRGLDMFAIPARELVQRMGEYTSIEADLDDPASLVGVDPPVGHQIQLRVEQMPIQFLARQATPAAFTQDTQHRFGTLHFAYLPTLWCPNHLAPFARCGRLSRPPWPVVTPATTTGPPSP
jgi:hypothetical protein